MKSYLDLVQHVLDNGTLKKNRTGTDTLMSFGYHYKVDLSKGFPTLNFFIRAFNFLYTFR